MARKVKEIFERVWQLALPYQDQRDDPGHAEITLQYAQSLVASEAGDEDIVIPAIILHDTGYSQLPRERRLQVFGKDSADEVKLAVRLEHQEAGVRLAGEILDRVGYPPQMRAEILEIISQHDTRKGFISKSEGLVRDSDKLWRFSRKGFEAAAMRHKADQESRCKDLEANIEKPGYFYSERAKQIAREELEARKRELSCALSPGGAIQGL